MPHRNGKKFCGTHTTYNDLSAKVADIAIHLDDVKKISPGVLSKCGGTSCGTQRVKFTDHEAFIVLTVRQSGSVQELRVYWTHDIQTTRTALARALRDHQIPIAFRH